MRFFRCAWKGRHPRRYGPCSQRFCLAFLLTLVLKKF